MNLNRGIRFCAVVAAACCLCLVVAGELHAQAFWIGDSAFMRDGKPVQIISGEMHYLRIPHEYWRDRLRKARAMGLNTVATYVFWNAHEPRPGEFNFSGDADVAAFVRTAKEEGLMVILRPGPYACAEWEFGGFPSWLLKDSTVRVRSRDERFIAAAGRYMTRLGQELAPLQWSNGGPIIMVQVENEYGSYGNDTLYERQIRDLIRIAGFTVPLFTADGPTQMPNAVLSNTLPAVNGATGDDVFQAINRYRPHGPYLVAEFYPGWLDHWGESHASVAPGPLASSLDEMLGKGMSVNLYMFHGGTNFGYMSGANFGGHFQPQPTSYDYDAPLDEAGRPTEKFFALRNVILKHLADTSGVPKLPPPAPQLSPVKIPLPESASLFDAGGAPVGSPSPLTMEELDQSYGAVVYRTELPAAGEGELRIKGLRDYAVVYLDGMKVGSLDRRYRQTALQLRVPEAPAKLDIYVENGGRINYGREMLDNRKGIIGDVTFLGQALHGWEMTRLPMDSITGIPYKTGFAGEFHRGWFSIGKPADGFLDMSGWGKGTVWINGRNLGRFWHIGPQQTMYVPAPWLKKGSNEIVVLELEDRGKRDVAWVRDPVLDKLEADPLKPPPPVRATRVIDLSGAKPVSEGSLSPDPAPQDRFFPPVTGRYVCLQSLNSERSDSFASVAEFYLLDEQHKPLPREGWSIAAVDCEETDAEDGKAENAIDGDPETIWHTLWGERQPPHPHELVVDLGKTATVAGFRYVARPTNSPGKIRDYRLYVSNGMFSPDPGKK